MLHICINAVTKDDVALHEFLDAIIQAIFGFEAGLFNFFVGNNVVAFVWIFANRRFQKYEARNVLLNFFAKLYFRKVCI